MIEHDANQDQNFKCNEREVTEYDKEGHEFQRNEWEVTEHDKKGHKFEHGKRDMRQNNSGTNSSAMKGETTEHD